MPMEDQGDRLKLISHAILNDIDISWYEFADGDSPVPDPDNPDAWVPIMGLFGVQGGQPVRFWYSPDNGGFDNLTTTPIV